MKAANCLLIFTLTALSLVLSTGCYSEELTFELSKGVEDIQGNNNTIIPFKGFLKSAIIPGWGETGLGAKAGYAFFGVEVLLWSSRFYFSEEIKINERAAYLYALHHAGLKPGDYDNEFLHILTRYNSSGFGAGGYNENILRQAQQIYPGDPVRQDEYLKQNAILDEDLSWDWGSRDQRRQYSIKRKNADHNRDYVKFVTGVIVANHIISAINSVRLTNRINRENRLDLGLDLSNPQQPTATISYKF